MKIPVIAYVSASSFVLPAVAGMVRYNRLNIAMKVFLFFCLFACLELGGELVLGLKRINNTFLPNYSLLGESAFIAVFYLLSVENKKVRQSISALGMLFLFIWMIDKMYFETPNQLNDEMAIASRVFIILISVLTLHTIVKERQHPLFDDGVFWALCGALVYSAGALLIVGLSSQILKMGVSVLVCCVVHQLVPRDHSECHVYERFFLQVQISNIIWVISLGTAVLVIFAIAYILVVLSSSRRVSETQKMRAEEVAKSADRYKALFEHSLAGMMKFSPDSWKVLEANASLLLIFGCRTVSDLEQCFAELSSPARQFIAHALAADGSITEYQVQAKASGGRDIWVLFSAKVVQGDDDVHAVIIDITKRKLSEAMVIEQAALLNEAQDAIIVLGDGELITFWNRGAELTYGWESREVAGRPLQQLLYGGDKKQDFLKIVETVDQFQKWSGECRHQRKDGKEILVDSRWRVIQNKNGSPAKLMIVNSDITAKKRLEAQFIKTQKMESIALLTGGIAHDLQNILAPVTMSIGLLRAELKDPTSLTVLRAVEESAQSGLQLVKNILTYGRGIVGERVSLDLSVVIQKVLEIFERSLPPSIVIDTEIFGTDWNVLGDMSQLKQVILNICINARDAMPDGGVLGIKLEDCFFENDDLDAYPEAHAGPYVVASISDSGVGISELDIERIFEPFFTTKEGGEGVGLGLSIVLGIVRSHGGFVTADSIVNRGTTFRVYLPRFNGAEG